MIQVGDRVRSFDFAETFDDGAQFGRDLEGERACYVEGTVLEMSDREGCSRYEIHVDRDVFGGEDSDRRVGQVVYPPVNGTPKSFGGACDFVELV
jgi:hypothetical protein